MTKQLHDFVRFLFKWISCQNTSLKLSLLALKLIEEEAHDKHKKFWLGHHCSVAWSIIIIVIKGKLGVVVSKKVSFYMSGICFASELHFLYTGHKTRVHKLLTLTSFFFS